MIAGFLLDGGSHRIIKDRGELIPNIRNYYINSKTSAKIISETPALSPVCWVSFLTGRDPSYHNIYGFIERDFDNNSFYIPNYKHIKSETLISILDQKGLRFAMINIPGTYPPARSKNGLIISDFLSPSLELAVNHKWLLPILNSMDYIIDINPYEHNHNKNILLNQMNKILDARKKLLFWLSRQNLDIILFHIMEFDRLCHYFFNDIYDENSPYFLSVQSILHRIDSLFRDFLDLFSTQKKTFLLSDHGFKNVKYEFFPNSHFYQKGLLSLDKNKINTKSNDLPVISPSIYFSLYPGRIYALEPATLKRSIDPMIQYSQITNIFDNIKNPYKIINEVIPSKDIYDNASRVPYHFLLKPAEGIDIKGFITDTILRPSSFQGIHDDKDGIFAMDTRLDIAESIRISEIRDKIFVF